MVKHCGITDVAVVESPVQAADGDSTVVEVVYVDSASGRKVILEVLIVTVGDSGVGLSDVGEREGWARGNNSATAGTRGRETQQWRHP